MDPPITPQGVLLARQQGLKIRELIPPHYSISLHASPFLRCIQTALCFGEVLSRNSGKEKPVQLHVHNELSEVMSPSVFPGHRGSKNMVIAALEINRLAPQ